MNTHLGVFLLLVCIILNSPAEEWLNYTDGNRVNAFACHKDSIWVGTVGGLVLINKKTDSITFFNKANSKLACIQISSLATDPDGRLYIGGLWFQNFMSENEPQYLDQDYVSRIIAPDNKSVYCGWGTDLRILKENEWDSITIGSINSSKFKISSIITNKQKDSILVGTNEGLFWVINDSLVFEILPYIKINALLFDQYGKKTEFGSGQIMVFFV